MRVDEFGLRADDHDSSLRTNLGGKDMAASIRHLRFCFRVGPQVASLRTSVKLRCWGEIIIRPGSERKVQSRTGPQGNNVFIAFPS